MGWIYDLKQYGTPSLKEWRQYLITVLVLSFVAGFNDKSSDGLGLGYVINFVKVIFIILISIFASNLVSRAHSTIMGYNSEYNFSINGLLIGIMLVFVSNGYFWYFAPGYHTINMNETGRLGHYRYGLRMKDWSRSAASGVFAYVVFAVIAHLSAQGNPTVDLFVKINLFLAFYSMLPFPENNGLNIFFGQRNLYFFLLAAMIGTVVMMRFLSSFLLILLFGLIIGIIGAVVWTTQVEADKKK